MESESRCFVRVWHDQDRCQKTGSPLLLVAYQCSLEGMAVPPEASFCDLIHYNAFSRQRVRSVRIAEATAAAVAENNHNKTLRVVLAREPFVRGEAEQRHKKVVFYDAAMRSRQGVFTVAVIVAYALGPGDDAFRYPVHFGGSSDWAQNAYLSADYVDAERPGDIEVVVELRSPLVRPARAPHGFLNRHDPMSHPDRVEAWLLS